MKLKKPVKKIGGIFVEILMVIPCVCICIISRYVKKDIDVGLGPMPLINNVYHKTALIEAGFSAETFVNNTWFISDEFDLDLSKWFTNGILKHFIPYYLFCRALLRYRVLFISFSGGPLVLKLFFLHVLEPIFYKLANVKIVAVPFGGDVQVLTHSNNLYYKHTIICDYPEFWKNYALTRKNIDRWTRHADWIITGGDCLDYMYHWNSLVLSGLSIDTRNWVPAEKAQHVESTKLRILHAPNHPAIKGTKALIRTIELLKKEGLELELILLEGVPNYEIRRAMEDVDLVADQFVIGWYGMFAVEAMAMGKPVLCYLRADLIELYVKAGMVIEDEIPLINTDLPDIASRIRWAYDNREELRIIGKKGREFVQKYNSTERVGRFFSEILSELGISSG
jgi:glycosyltransferase involved in cell wall biosynthesis